MKQFQVPQFLTVEDKILGPLTIKQSAFLGTAAALIFITRIFFGSLVFWPIAVLAGGLAVGLAFLKINERPLWVVAKNALAYLVKPRVYIWKRGTPERAAEKAKSGKREETVTSVPKISESKLSDLAWSLDIKQESEKK